MRFPPLINLALLVLAAVSAFAQTPSFTVVNTGLDATFGNAGKAVLDPQVTGFTGVAYGNGLFVATGASVGESVVRWATSPDGVTWTGRSQPVPSGPVAYVTYQTSKVHFLNGKFIFFTGFGDNSGGVAGTTWCYSSADGLTWTANKVTDGRINVGEFDASPTLYVAAGSNGSQVASADLVTWVSRPVLAGGSGYDHLDLAYFNGKFFSSINGFGGTTYSSSDAVTWTALSTLTLPGGSRIEAGNGVLIGTAGGSQYQSTDGVAFTKLTTTATPGWYPPGGTPRYTSAGFVALGTNLTTFQGGYMVSADGASWTALGVVPNAPAPPAGFLVRNYTYVDITYGDGKYVLVGTDTAQAAFSIQTLPLVMTFTAGAAPTITAQPVSISAVDGHAASFTVAAQSSDVATFQWKHDGVAITGATDAIYNIAHVTAADAGSYVVVVTNSAGTTSSAPASLSLVSADLAGHISNVSIRGDSAPGQNALIVGTVVAGTGNKPLLVRAIGPSLADYGVTSPLPDPELRLVAQGSGVTLASNGDWAGNADVAQVSGALGAFALNATSKDAAVYAPGMAAGPYTVVVTDTTGGSGPTLAEVYDAEDSTSFAASSPRLVNISGRGHVGTGANLLVAGFVINGLTPVHVLVRGVGPALAGYGVSNTLADPELQLFRSGTTEAIAANDDWGTADAAEIATLAANAGAFPLASGSKDAALLITLVPGVYTVHLTGANSSTGIGLIEVYEVR